MWDGAPSCCVHTVMNDNLKWLIIQGLLGLFKFCLLHGYHILNFVKPMSDAVFSFGLLIVTCFDYEKWCMLDHEGVESTDELLKDSSTHPELEQVLWVNGHGSSCCVLLTEQKRPLCSTVAATFFCTQEVLQVFPLTAPPCGHSLLQ